MLDVNKGSDIQIKNIDERVVHYMTDTFGSKFNIPVKLASTQLWVKYQKQGVKDKQIPVVLIKRGQIFRQFFSPKVPAYFKQNQYDKDHPRGSLTRKKIVCRNCYYTDRPLYIDVHYTLTIYIKKLTQLNKIIQFFANNDDVYWNSVFIIIDKNQMFNPIPQQYQKHYTMDIPMVAKKMIVNPIRTYKPIINIQVPIKQLDPRELSKK